VPFDAQSRQHDLEAARIGLERPDPRIIGRRDQIEAIGEAEGVQLAGGRVVGQHGEPQATGSEGGQRGADTRTGESSQQLQGNRRHPAVDHDLDRAWVGSGGLRSQLDLRPSKIIRERSSPKVLLGPAVGGQDPQHSIAANRAQHVGPGQSSGHGASQRPLLVEGPVEIEDHDADRPGLTRGARRGRLLHLTGC
jgi:hypothetical protein